MNMNPNGKSRFIALQRSIPLNIKALILTTWMFAAVIGGNAPAQEPPTPQQPVMATADQITVNVLGLVRKPSRCILPKGATVVDALASAGGAAPDADLKKVRLTHKTTGSKPDSILIDVKQILGGEAKDIVLRDGDTLYLTQLMFRY
jgi:hypothetical protein